jgi:DNA-binding transcriptional LysR family regulator
MLRIKICYGVVVMNIQKFLVFVKTAELGSLTKAGDILGYTQPAISQILNSLEREWDVRLFTRDASRVRLTSDGELLLPFVTKICDDHSDLLNLISEMRGLDRGLVRIAALPSVATHWLPNIIGAFSREYPKIDFEIRRGNFYAEIEDLTANGQVDIGFLRLPVARQGLESVFLETDSIMAVIPEGHPLADCENFPIEKLGGEPMILLGSGYDDDINEVFGENGIKPSVCCVAWDDSALMAMVESGLGISILPELVLRRSPYRLVKKELSRPYSRKLGVVAKDMKNLSPAARRFLDFLDYRNEVKT